jgi:hypothetical protein
MKKFGISFETLDWDVKAPKMWKAINNGKGKDKVVQIGNAVDKDADKVPHRLFDGDAKSWAPDIHKGTEPSSLVKIIDYNSKDLTLTVTYRDGFKATYHDISPEMAKEFSEADSKGRWALANLWDRDYS